MEIQCYCSNSFFFLSPHSVAGKVCGNIIILVSKFIIRIPHQHSPARAPPKILLMGVPGCLFFKGDFYRVTKNRPTRPRLTVFLLIASCALCYVENRPPKLFCGRKVGPKRQI